MLKYSRHSKRRMRLYNLDEDTVKEVINFGMEEHIDVEKVSYIASLSNYNYSIKVICKNIGEDKIVITVYLLKKRL